MRAAGRFDVDFALAEGANLGGGLSRRFFFLLLQVLGLVEFLLTALILFAIIKAANKAKNMKKKEEEAPAEPTTKVCPFCQSEISIKATRCPHCTSELKD